MTPPSVEQWGRRSSRVTCGYRKRYQQSSESFSRPSTNRAYLANGTRRPKCFPTLKEEKFLCVEVAFAPARPRIGETKRKLVELGTFYGWGPTQPQDLLAERRSCNGWPWRHVIGLRITQRLAGRRSHRAEC